MNVLVVDKGFSVTGSKREITDEGFLKVPGKVARTGVQQYLAKELGITDRNPNDIINVYRPPEEVFKPESLDSYDNTDVTVEHPTEMVDSKTYKQVSVGHAISGGRQEGEFVVVDYLVKDQSAIDAILSGKAELSAGYRAEYVPQKGTAEDGTPYEFIQRDIRINHTALVDRARAGREARLFDRHGEPEMTVTVTLDSGNSVEVADKSTATLIQSTIDGLRKQVQDAETAKTEAEKAKDEAEAKKEKMDEEMEKMKEKTSDSAISERLKAIAATRDAARKVAGEEFTCDSLDVLTIQREALAKARPSVAWADKSDAYVAAAWDQEMEKSEEERKKEEAGKTTDSLGSDIAKLYTGDNGQMVGHNAYAEFLQGGAK